MRKPCFSLPHRRCCLKFVRLDVDDKKIYVDFEGSTSVEMKRTMWLNLLTGVIRHVFMEIYFTIQAIPCRRADNLIVYLCIRCFCGGSRTL